MDRTKLLSIAVVGLLFLNLLTISFLYIKGGRPGPRGLRPPGGEGPSRLIIDRLHFDSEQQQQYQTLISAHRQQIRRLTDESVQLYTDYYGLLKADVPDTVQAAALSRQIAGNQQTQAAVNFAHFNEIKSLCRPDQQANFRQLVSELSSLFGHQQRPPRRGPNGPPEGRPDGPPENLPPRP